MMFSEKFGSEYYKKITDLAKSEILTKNQQDTLKNKLDQILQKSLKEKDLITRYVSYAKNRWSFLGRIITFTKKMSNTKIIMYLIL